MIQKVKTLFRPFSRVTSQEVSERRQNKLQETQQYLRSRRSFDMPAAPMGFKPRSTSAYFFSNYR